MAAATILAEREQKERPPTPFDDPSDSNDDDNDKPQYKDPFGSFGI